MSCALVSGAFAARSAHADEPLPRVYVGVAGGVNLVLGDWDLDESDSRGYAESADTSAIVHLHLGLDLASWLSLEVGGAVLPLTAGDDSATVFQLEATARVPFSRGAVEPYALIGLGGYLNPGGDRGADQDPEGHYGVGVAIAATDWLDVRLEARHTMSDGLTATLSHAIGLTAGLDFQLWRAGGEATPEPEPEPERDGDGDGVVDRRDRCPAVAGTTALQGCPDQDGDGIGDGDDRCPAVAGTAALGGCPDQDGDGVADGDDRCPGVPGPRALGGCPDGDGDGVADGDDQCPDKAGVRPTGCPEAVAPPAEDPLASLLEPIPFDSSSAELSLEARAALDRIASGLAAHPDVRVHVDGHADATGSDDVNDPLSLARAARVKELLVERGVPAARIETRGYGSHRPVAGNDTPEGRARNRRVEIGIIAH